MSERFDCHAMTQCRVLADRYREVKCFVEHAPESHEHEAAVSSDTPTDYVMVTVRWNAPPQAKREAKLCPDKCSACRKNDCCIGWHHTVVTRGETIAADANHCCRECF